MDTIYIAKAYEEYLTKNPTEYSVSSRVGDLPLRTLIQLLDRAQELKALALAGH